MIGIAVVGGLAAGCGGGASAPAPAGKPAGTEQPVAQAPAVTPAPAATPKEQVATSPLPPIAYESKDRRDPFIPVPVAKEKVAGLQVGTVKLVGIIQGARLLALVEAPDGLGYIVKSGDVLGNGRVTDITSDSITFAVTGGADKRETILTLRLARE
jgi:Tfp pilus assembly protein PilP